MSHTPAPWTVNEENLLGEIDEHHIFIEPGVAVIERKIEGSNQHDMADAQLIAAAPELLAALHQLAKCAAVAVENPTVYFSEAMAQARTAIAKATGGKA